MISKLHSLPLFAFTSGATLVLALFGIKTDGFTALPCVHILLFLSQGALAFEAMRALQKQLPKETNKPS